MTLLPGDTDRPDPLHVAVSANRHQSAAGSADHSSAHRQRGDRLNIADSVRVVGDAHRPRENRVLGIGVDIRN